MKLETLRLLEHVHGHLGWLAVAAMIHPAIMLRRTERRAPISVVLAALLPTLCGALGALLYPSYSKLVRRAVYVASMRHGLLFERKEHLAFAAIALSWAGCALYFAKKGRVAHLAFVAAAGLALISATLGTIVASFRSF
jgi:hypothetical protein